MVTILDKILAKKQEEVKELMAAGSITEKARSEGRPSFSEILRAAKKMKIIAEFKRASPSKGDIGVNVDPVEQARKYVSFGADAMSVLTDETFFKGNMADLENVRKAVDIPLLCKDFIIDEIQIDQAKQAGADLILLIVAALSPLRLKELADHAKRNSLEVITEVHDEAELEQALINRADIIGINNRNLKTFEVDLNVTERLGKRLQNSGGLFISESGIKTLEDVERVKAAGARGILVGETFMSGNKLSENLNSFKIQL